MKKTYNLYWVYNTHFQIIATADNIPLLKYKAEQLKKEQQYKCGLFMVRSSEGFKYQELPKLTK